MTVAHDGTLTATLTWTQSNDLDLYATAVACAPRFNIATCHVLASSTQTRGRMPEQVSVSVHAGDRVRFWIENLDDAASAAYTLDVTAP